MHVKQEEFMIDYVNVKLIETYLYEEIAIMLVSLNLSLNVL